MLHGPFEPHHVSIDAEVLKGNGGLGRVLFLPGADARARRIAERFEGLQVYPSPRQHNVYTGAVRDGERLVDVAAVATDMGSGSAEVVVSELILLGARRLVRVGTSGSLQPQRVRVGDCVIATSAVRDEHASEAYAPREVPAVAHPHWVGALIEAAHAQGQDARCFVGTVHSKDALYGRELGIGPLAARHAEYMAVLQAMNVLATEMETSTIFTLAAAHGDNVASLADNAGPAGAVKAGAILAIIGDDLPFASAEVVFEAEGRAIDIALGAAKRLIRAGR